MSISGLLLCCPYIPYLLGPCLAVDCHHHRVVCSVFKEELRNPHRRLYTLWVGQVGRNVGRRVPEAAVVLEGSVLDCKGDLSDVSRVHGTTGWWVGQSRQLWAGVLWAVGGEELANEVEASQASCGEACCCCSGVACTHRGIRVSMLCETTQQHEMQVCVVEAVINRSPSKKLLRKMRAGTKHWHPGRPPSTGSAAQLAKAGRKSPPPKSRLPVNSQYKFSLVNPSLQMAQRQRQKHGAIKQCAMT